jgi:ABC-type Fe3+/spermidine/putrescine transport system ATPase subunit
MTAPFLRLSGVTKRYGGRGGIEDVSLEVANGESVIVLGPSGSGKTTLLRLIAGLERPDTGDIWLDARRVAEGGRNIAAANQRRVGFVFQDLALWPHLTAGGNLQFIAESFGIEKRLRGIAVDEVRRLCRLAPDLLDRYPHQLSGGEQQRVALARALVGTPHVLLLDEPLSSLDADLRADLRLELAALQRQLQLTMICVTHDADDAEALADRIVTIQNGRLC